LINCLFKLTAALRGSACNSTGFLYSLVFDGLDELLHYLFSVKKSLSESKPDDVDLFTKNVQTFVKDVLANFKEYQLFCGRCILLDFVNTGNN